MKPTVLHSGQMLARTEPRVRVLCAQSLKRKSALWNNFNRIDFWIFNVAGEGDLELPVSDFHRHRLNVGAVRSASLCPHIKILELAALHIEGKHASAGTGDAIESFGEVKFGDVFAVGNIARKGVHPVMFRQKKSRVFGVGDRCARVTLNYITAIKSLFGLPKVDRK